MSSSFLLGLDLGTSGVKVIALPVDGGETFEASATYPLRTPHPGWSEQDPDDWWRGVAAAIHTVLDAGHIAPEQVAGVALSGQMHGATLLDASGTVLRPCILWNDQRSAPQCDQITRDVGLDTLLDWVANPALAGFTAPKLLWVREHEPHIWQKTGTVLLPKDYINYRLTGQLSTEVSDASGTLLFDVARRRWSDDMLRALNIPLFMLPPVRNSIDVVGRVTVEAAGVVGLQAGTPVVAGGADNACAAVGIGVIGPGLVATSLGTSGTVIAPTDRPYLDPGARLHTFCHAVPDTWYLMGVVLSAGGSLRWFRDTIGVPGSAEAAGAGRDAYDVIMEEASSVPAGSEGLTFLPYLTGERTPHGDADARGVFFGLSLRHTRAHLARSVIEGVTYALADSVHLMRGLGLEVGAVRTTGGGARSSLWRQIQADVLDARVHTALSDAGPAWGAAILAGVGVGAFPSIEHATARLVTAGDEVVPDEETVAIYSRYHNLYDELYPALQGSFQRLGKIIQG